MTKATDGRPHPNAPLMHDKQLAFYRALLAPFGDECLSSTTRGGRRLTYIDSRTLQNRLDSVCGPHGWKVRYRATRRGYMATLAILCPVQVDEAGSVSWGWIAKSDGAGFEEMGSRNKTTGEFETDVDNDEKSAYTNAFRRVAQNAWGIARYLYDKGVPEFLDPRATAPASTPAARSSAPSQSAAPSARPSAPTSAPTRPPGNGGQFDNFQLPRAGKAVFAWTKQMEQHFGTTLVNGMGQNAKELGYGDKFAQWTQEQAHEVCMGAIDHLRTTDAYRGEFDHLLADAVA